MDIEFLSPQPQEPASIDMRLCIEAETDNRGEEEKGKSEKYRREKKGSKELYASQNNT
jgi:hypothetical protein